jgi:hypothetical protein
MNYNKKKKIVLVINSICGIHRMYSVTYVDSYIFYLYYNVLAKYITLTKLMLFLNHGVRVNSNVFWTVKTK